MSLSADELQALGALLDEVIPPSADGRMPGAGEIGLAERVAAELAKVPLGLAAVQQGLASLDRVARGELGAGFADLQRTDRTRILEQVAEAEPGLVPNLLFPTYVAFYEHPRVLVALGREARPPYPDGYELDPFDSSLLDAVRKRGRLYRGC